MSRARVFEWHKRFKEGHEDVKDDLKSEKLSTNRMKVNVERVRQVLSGDHQFAIRMIASQVDFGMSGK